MELPRRQAPERKRLGLRPRNDADQDRGLLRVVFERRCLIRPDGDADEMFFMEIRNIGSVPYDFTAHEFSVRFITTDARAEYITAYDPIEQTQWMWDHPARSSIATLFKCPSVPISPGEVRCFGGHVRAARQLCTRSNEIVFADPFVFDFDPLDVASERYRTVVVFPERVDGWNVTSSSHDVTTRTAAWEFARENGAKHLLATARAPATNDAALTYDDIIAELHILLGHLGCKPTVTASAVLEKARLVDHALVRRAVSPLARFDAADWPERRSLVARALEKMRDNRAPFLRSSRYRVTVTRDIEGQCAPGLAVPAPIEVFVSYADVDKGLWEELDKHLEAIRQDGTIHTFSAKDIVAGQNRRLRSDEWMRRARVFLLLFSADFVASDVCREQQELALRRHGEGQALVIPVILRACVLPEAITHLRQLPVRGGPVASQQDRDAAFVEVVQGIIEAMRNLTY